MVGNAAVDLTFVVDRYPRADEKCSAVSFDRRPGGQGVNMVLVAARLGAHCTLVSKIGQDADGAMVADELTTHDVDTRAVVQQPDGRTPLVSIVVDSGQNTRTCVHDKTGLVPLSLAEVDPAVAAEAEVLLVDGRFGDVCLALSTEVRARGAKVVAAVERLDTRNRALCAQADVVIVPEKLKDFEGADLHAAATALAEEFVADLLVTRGASGCVIYRSGVADHVPGVPATVIDTVGAGDGFAAAVAVGLLWGWPLRTAAALGNYVGAKVCEGAGIPRHAIPNHPTEAHVLSALPRVP